MFEEGNILDWNLSNFISVGLIGATWLAIFALGRSIMMANQTSNSAPNTATGAGNVVPFNAALNQNLNY